MSQAFCAATFRSGTDVIVMGNQEGYDRYYRAYAQVMHALFQGFSLCLLDSKFGVHRHVALPASQAGLRQQKDTHLKSVCAITTVWLSAVLEAQLHLADDFWKTLRKEMHTSQLLCWREVV